MVRVWEQIFWTKNVKFLILRRTDRMMTINVLMSTRKINLLFSELNKTLISSTNVLKKTSNTKFHENPSSASGFLCERTDMTKLIVAFRNFPNDPNETCSAPLFKSQIPCWLACECRRTFALSDCCAADKVLQCVIFSILPSLSQSQAEIFTSTYCFHAVGIATRYGLDGPGIEYRWRRARFSAPVHTGPGAHPASYVIGTWSFPGVVLTTHPRFRNEVKERVDLYIYSKSGPSWTVIGWNLPLPLPYCLQTRSSHLRTQFMTSNSSGFGALECSVLFGTLNCG